jgi:hypothetical protein
MGTASSLEDGMVDGRDGYETRMKIHGLSELELRDITVKSKVYRGIQRGNTCFLFRKSNAGLQFENSLSFSGRTRHHGYMPLVSPQMDQDLVRGQRLPDRRYMGTI